MKSIATKNAPAALGPYSQGIVAGNLIYTSGQLGLNPDTEAFAGETIEEQTEQAIKNIAEVLKEGGSDLSKAVKTTCFLQNIGDFAAFNGVYERFFTEKPARSCVEVAALPKGALVEIEVIAEV